MKIVQPLKWHGEILGNAGIIRATDASKVCGPNERYQRSPALTTPHPSDKEGHVMATGQSSVTYRTLPEFPGYRIGDDGSVWSCWRSTGRPAYTHVMGDRWKQLKPQPRPEDGRKRYTLKHANGSYRRIYAARLVLLAFVGPRPTGMEGCHDNGICTDDALTNLRWDTPIANKADMLRHGTRVMGENHPKTKLSDDAIRQVLEIRARGEKLSNIAGMFNVSVARISQVCRKGGR